MTPNVTQVASADNRWELILDARNVRTQESMVTFFHSRYCSHSRSSI